MKLLKTTDDIEQALEWIEEAFEADLRDPDPMDRNREAGTRIGKGQAP